MRLFVWCAVHPAEKVYLQFTKQPSTRDEIPWQFSVQCPQGVIYTYARNAVEAEVGPTFLAGAAVGALLFLIDPLLGLLGALGGAVGVGATEADKVKVFNSSGDRQR